MHDSDYYSSCSRPLNIHIDKFSNYFLVGTFDGGQYYYNSNCSYTSTNRTVWFELHTPDVLELEIYTGAKAEITVLSGTCSNLQCVGCSTGNSSSSSYCNKTKFTTYDTSYYVALSAPGDTRYFDLNIAVKELVQPVSCSSAANLNLPLYTPISTYFTTANHAVTQNDDCYGSSYKSPTYWSRISVYDNSSSQFQLSVNTCSPNTQMNTHIEVVSSCSGGYCYAKSAQCNGSTYGSTVLVNLYYGSYYVGISSGNSTTGYVSATFLAIPLFDDVQEANEVEELEAPQNDVLRTQKSKTINK